MVTQRNLEIKETTTETETIGEIVSCFHNRLFPQAALYQSLNYQDSPLFLVRCWPTTDKTTTG